MWVVMQGLCFTNTRWPWFVASSKKQALDVLHRLGYRKDQNVLVANRGRGPEYAKLVQVDTVEQVLAEAGVK